MNCEKCQELISDFLDGALTAKDRAMLDAHFEHCAECASVHEDLHTIITVAREARAEYIAPSNERALWLRIANTVESEAGARRSRAAAIARRQNFWGSLLDRRWEMTLPQLTTAVAAIIVFVSLATVLGLRSLHGDTDVAANNSITTTEDIAPAAGPTPLTGRFSQQQIDIEYWKQRVEQRRSHWNPNMREAFDRNLSVIDQAVNDSLNDLSQHPHDEVSEEALNAAMRDKMELLKEFSDL